MSETTMACSECGQRIEGRAPMVRYGDRVMHKFEGDCIAALRAALVAPRLTPLQAAALVLAKWGWGGDKHTVEEASDAMDCARAVLAAAVGALPGGPQPDECSIGSGMERQLVLRAALLAALTEGGTA